MPKTTVKVRAKQWDFFNAECKAASLRRDDLLNRVLPGEIALLAKIAPCDEIGATWLKRHWIDRWSTKDVELRPVPVLLSEAVIDGLNSECSSKRVPRDAFFDCALEYLTLRLYEAVVVVKNPRTSRDLVSQIAFQLNEERDELSDDDRTTFVNETVADYIKAKSLEKFSDSFYQDRLSFDAGRVEQENIWRELSDELVADRPVPQDGSESALTARKPS